MACFREPRIPRDPHDHLARPSQLQATSQHVTAWPSRLVPAAALVLAAVALALLPGDVSELQHLTSGLDAGTPVLTGGEETAPQVLGQSPKPLKGQKPAPCVKGVEVEATGFCWLPLEARPPKCPPQSVQGVGKCLIPVWPVPRPPTSFGP